MTPRTIEAAAAARYPHGSPVRVEDGAAHLETDPARMNGVTKRPHMTAATHHEKGEALLVQTHGGIMVEIDGQSRWVELQYGRIING